MIWGKSFSNKQQLKTETQQLVLLQTDSVAVVGQCADVEDHGHTGSKTCANYPAAPALFKDTATLNCFVCLF